MKVYATIEGLESCYDSPGLGVYPIVFTQGGSPIALGQRARGVNQRTRKPDLHTGTIQSIKRIDSKTFGFRTKRTTYLLKFTSIEEADRLFEILERNGNL